MKTIILASNSKARLKLLQDNGYNVVVKPTNIKEKSNKTEPDELVVDLAQQKLKAFFKEYGKPSKEIVLCADTMIFFEKELIGKAKDINEAYKTLKRLSNKQHQIYSGFSLYIPSIGIKSGYDSVDVTLKNLSDLTIMNYLATDEWKGAAGSYRIQEKGGTLIKEINGEFNVAVGLPLIAISDLIKLT